MKTFINAIVLGLFGAIAVALSFKLEWQTWVMFLAWVSYYLFGKSIKTSIPIFLQIVLGILMGVLIQFLGQLFTNGIGGIGFPLAVFLCIGSLSFLSQIKYLSNIPVWFLGLIVFFGVHPKIEFLPLLSLLIPIIAGFIFAYLNDAALKWVSSNYNE